LDLHWYEAALFILFAGGNYVGGSVHDAEGMFHKGQIGDRSNLVESNKMSALIHCHDWSCTDSIVWHQNPFTQLGLLAHERRYIADGRTSLTV
jgi:hypothetical protein